MGEAKRRQLAQNQALLEDLRRWSRPPSEIEERLVLELKNMEPRIVRRAPVQEMKALGMQPQECHLNCWRFVDLDLQGKSRQVFGWVVLEDCYVLHSVIERDGHLTCITPSDLGGVKEIHFVPDPLIEWRDLDDGSTVFVRSGVPIDIGVRMNPEEEIARCNYAIQRIESGMPPHQACDLTEYVPQREK